MSRKIDVFRLLTLVDDNVETNAANFLESLEFQFSGLILAGIITKLEEMFNEEFEIMPSFLGVTALDNDYVCEYDEMKDFTIARIRLQNQTADEVSEKAKTLPESVHFKEIFLCGECTGNEIAFSINKKVI